MTTDSGRTKPFLLRPTPHPDEHLLSWWMRVASSNVFARTLTPLDSIGVHRGRVSCRPQVDESERHALSVLLGIAATELRALLHEDVTVRPGCMDWWGTPISKKLVDFSSRRVAVGSLKKIGYVPACWMIRPINACVLSGERLISVCPTCKKKLGWHRAIELWRCDKCNAELPAGEVDRSYDRVQSAVALISQDPEKRAAALRALPEPFQRWDAGDVFEAVVEMGLSMMEMADRLSVCPRDAVDWRSQRNKLLQESGTAILLQGHQFVMDWPSSFTSAIRRSSESVEGETSIRSTLGPFARLLSPYRADSPIKLLLKDMTPRVVRGLAVPLRVHRTSKLFSSRSQKVVTLRDAASRYDVSVNNLRRLVPSGRCFVYGVKAHRGTKLFDASMLARSAELYKKALRPSSAAMRLGIPAFVVSELVQRGYLARVTDHDANLMTVCDFLVDPDSVRLMREKFESLVITPDGVDIWTALGSRRFEPAAWVGLLGQAMSDNSLLLGLASSCGKGLVERLQFDVATAEAALRDVPESPPSNSVVVSVECAARLLQTYRQTINNALDSGLLTAQSDAGQITTIKLSDLQDFYRQYATHAVAIEAGVGAATSVVGSRRGLIWRRADLSLSHRG